MSLIKSIYLILLIIGILIVIGNLGIIVFDPDIQKWKKTISCILALFLITSIIGQFFISKQTEDENKRKINDLDIIISFTVDPTSIEAITSNNELARYLPNRNTIGVDKEFLRKLEGHKSEIYSEIFKDWSLSLSRGTGLGFKANCIEKINDFNLECIEAGRYSFHLRCNVSYNIKVNNYLNLRNIKELNSNILSLYIISNPTTSRQIIDNIRINLNTNEALPNSDTEFVYNSGFEQVLPQVNNALNNLSIANISDLIKQNTENLDNPIYLHTERGDGLWVWHIEKEFSKNEY